MLLNNGRRYPSTKQDVEPIHNYYERLVVDHAREADSRAAHDPDFLSDVACLALNRLPPRYVRHDVDMTFYLTPDEIELMTRKVESAVSEAIRYIDAKNDDLIDSKHG